MAEIKLGEKYRDRNTGFEGVVTAKHEYQNGCIRYSLETLHEGKIVTESFDEQTIEPVDGGRVKRRARSGGPPARSQESRSSVR